MLFHMAAAALLWLHHASGALEQMMPNTDTLDEQPLQESLSSLEEDAETTEPKEETKTDKKVYNSGTLCTAHSGEGASNDRFFFRASKKGETSALCTSQFDRKTYDRKKAPNSKDMYNLIVARNKMKDDIHEAQDKHHPIFARNFTFRTSHQSTPPCGEACNSPFTFWLTDEKYDGKELIGRHSNIKNFTGSGYRQMNWYDVFDEKDMSDAATFDIADLRTKLNDRSPHFWEASRETTNLMRNVKQRAVAYDLMKFMEHTEVNLWAGAVMEEASDKANTTEAKKEKKKELEISWLDQAELNFIYVRAYGSALSSFGGSLYDQTNMLEQYEEMKSYKGVNPLKLSDEDTDAMLEGWLGRQYTGNWNAWMWLSTNLMMKSISSGDVGGCFSRGCRPKPKPPKLESLSQLFKGSGVSGFVAIDQEDGFNNGHISPKQMVEKITNVPGLENMKALLKRQHSSVLAGLLDFSRDGRMFFPQFLAGMSMLVFASFESMAHENEGEVDGSLEYDEIVIAFKKTGISVTLDEIQHFYNQVLQYKWAGETAEEKKQKAEKGFGLKDFLLFMYCIFDTSLARSIFEMDRILAWQTLETSANARVLDYGAWHLIIGCMYDYLASYHDLVEAYMSKDAEAVASAWSTMVGSISNYGMWTNNALGIIKSGSPGAYEDEQALLQNDMQWIPTDAFIKSSKEEPATPEYYNGMKYVPHSDLVPVGCGMYCAADEERRKANAFVSTPWTFLHMLPTLPIYMGDMTLWDTKAPKREYFPSTMSEGIAYKRLIALRWMTWGLTVMHIANVREFYLDWTKYTKFPEEGSMDQRDSNHIYRLWTSFQLLWYQTWLKGAESDYKAMKQGKTARFTKKGLLRSTNLATLPKKQATLPQSKLGQPQGAMPTLPQQALSPLASDPIKLATTPLDAGATPAFLEVPDFHAHVVQMISPSNGTAPKLMSPALKYEWQFWRMGLRYMASWHTILSCSYDLASNIRGVQLAAKKVSLLVANFGDTCELLSASLEAYSEAQNNLLISLTNFGTWVSYHIPTTLIGYPAQVREYAVHHGRKPIARSKERAMLWTFMWSNIYYIIGTQITWTPTPMLGKEYAKNLGKETITGKKLSKKIAGLVPDTMLMPNADGQITGPLETTMPLTATKTYAKHLDDGIECSGGEVFGRIGDFAEMATYDVVGAMHQALSTGEESRPNHPGATNRLQKALDWLYKGGYDAAKPPVCTHKVPKKMMRKYVEAQISRMMPPPTGAANLPPWAPAYKPEVDNLMSDLWMVPRPGEAEKNMEDPSSASAPITRYPSAVLEVGFAAAMQPLGTGFMSMNPISTNMFPSITQPVALASTP